MRTFGFVNAVKIIREPGSETVLDAWRGAGQPLGNHSCSHLSLTRAPSFEAWQEDVIAGEPVDQGIVAMKANSMQVFAASFRKCC
ncbi:hypothetical protein SAMN05216320_1011149 [Duganella sp. OV458]|nr:hypothetical protein SAMN05216320_1011149 [Duganella sp. OV458]SDI55748.1 hypothetical protein SAMN05428973_101266 [Duganella sp. OV510]